MTREQQNQWEFGDLFEQKAEQVPTKKVYTVSEINRRAKNLLEDQLRDVWVCLLYTSPSPRDATLSRMPSSA